MPYYLRHVSTPPGVLIRVPAAGMTTERRAVGAYRCPLLNSITHVQACNRKGHDKYHRKLLVIEGTYVANNELLYTTSKLK